MTFPLPQIPVLRCRQAPRSLHSEFYARILPVDQNVRRHNDVLGISTDVNLIIFIERFLTIIKFS